jgi:uncharacterized membrane protein YeaQ/YmgE (transglycosylase-associated protein family)
MGFFAWIVVGAIAGFIAKWLTRTDGGPLMMIGLGIVGGLVGGLFGTSVLNVGTVTGLNLESIAVATVGAVVVVLVVGLATGARRARAA